MSLYQCGKAANANDTIWHCEQKDNHSERFDICDECITSLFDQKSQEISAICSSMDLCDEDMRLLSKILKKINDNPEQDKYKQINTKRLMSKIYNYELFLNILKEAGFKAPNDGLRLV